VSRICLRLELMSRSSDTIQLHRKPIAAFVLWATQMEASRQPQGLNKQSPATPHRVLELWDRIHFANPGPAAIYLDVLLSCTNVSRGRVTECPGLGQVARTASICVLRTLSGVGPTSAVARDMRQQYLKIIPRTTNFEDLSCCHTMNAIHTLLITSWKPWSFEWTDYKPSAQEHVNFVGTLIQVAYTRRPCGKVPRWVLRCVIDSLSQDPPAPTPVILNCLSIIGIDLDCDVSSARAPALDERYAQSLMEVDLSDLETSAQLGEVLGLITQKLGTMAEAADPDPIRTKRKAISALFPYAVWEEREGRHEILDMFLHVARASMRSGFMWRYIGLLVATLLNEESPLSMKRAIILTSPHIPWWQLANGEHLFQLWVVAALAVPYSADIGQSVVDTQLQIAYSDPLPPHVPVGMWSWLNKRPSLDPVCWGRYWGTDQDIVEMIRTLGDTEILKSYLLLVWSEWDDLRSGGFRKMCTSIREDLGGAGMGHHRQDLLRHLDHVLGQLGLGLGHLRQHKPSLDEDDIRRMKGQYRKLKELLLEADGETRITPTRELSRLIIILGVLILADMYRRSLHTHTFNPLPPDR
jgi:hypothetical protein